MAHECPNCGEFCYCDMEDGEFGDPEECVHVGCPVIYDNDEDF